VFTPPLLVRSPFALTTFQAELAYSTDVGHRGISIRKLDADAIVSQIRLHYVW
jgi:hypothetical protein